MVTQKLTKVTRRAALSTLEQQGAQALLAATFEFLRRNHIAQKSIKDFARRYPNRNARNSSSETYRAIIGTFESMGAIMATWFSNPQFLDSTGQPLPLSEKKGANSISRLIRVSGARIALSTAIELMRQSPSIRIRGDNLFMALKRVFILPNLEVPRAAFVVERYLETIQQNASRRRGKAALLLERSCHVSEVEFSAFAPLLRDIECRGTAFMDSLDGDLEGRRLRRSKLKRKGELGVLVFAWTKPTTARPKPLHDSRTHAKTSGVK